MSARTVGNKTKPNSYSTHIYYLSLSKHILRIHTSEFLPLHFVLLLLLQYLRLHLLVGLLHFLHLFLRVIHYPTQRLLACYALAHYGSTASAKYMPAFHLDWEFELFLALLANIIHLVLLYTLKGLFNILSCCQLRVAYSPPPLLLCPLEIPLLLPASFVIGPIMEIDAAVSKWTIARIMPILTESEVVIKPTGVSDGAIDSGWSLSFSELFLCIYYLIFC